LVFQLYLSTLATNRVKRQYTPLGGFEATPQQKNVITLLHNNAAAIVTLFCPEHTALKPTPSHY
jgi:hypothetical protein